jgi:hypothetical protein
VRKSGLILPSVGFGRKTQIPVRLGSFDPGVCSGSGWTVSSRDVDLVVHSEQRLNFFEWLVDGVQSVGDASKVR